MKIVLPFPMKPGKPLISFDYAIKYLLEDKRDYGIVEGFISALLKTIGHKEVKIIALLKPEINKQDPKNLRTLADVIVEDEDHHQYIIEIERNIKENAALKTCFNPSRLIVDNLAQSHDYTQISKVFHISLFHLPIGVKPDFEYVYHGNPVIHEKDTKKKLSVQITNPSTNEIFDVTNIMPEYFHIIVFLISDRLEKEIDEWLYMIKNNDIPHLFHSAYMKQVAEKLSLLKMSTDERAKYSSYFKDLYSEEMSYKRRNLDGGQSSWG
jgi:hypothetical protein